MHRLTLASVLVTSALLIAGCGKSCSSIQDEIEKIGREIQQNPESAFDHEEKLRKLRDELQEMGC